MQKINMLTDLTLLDEQASIAQIEQLIAQATTHHMAAICVYPKHLIHLPHNIKRATVLNFPSGEENHDKVLQNLEQITQHHLAEEIDYVFPYPLFLKEEKAKAFSQYQEIARHCVKNNLLLKVIIETGVLRDPLLIEHISSELIKKNCPFIKTSTGKTPVGATFDAAKAILLAIKKSDNQCGIKISGGIRSDEQALHYVDLAETMLSRQAESTWFRIGRSMRTPVI